MKLDINPEHYKYEDLQEVCDSVDNMKNQTSKQLLGYGEGLQVILSASRGAFETINYETAEDHVIQFKQKVCELQDELGELLESAIELTDLMGRKWHR